ncbi:MAG: RDD family protein [Thermodesulfobacteriota bacterium]
MRPVRYKVVFSGVLYPGKKPRNVKRELARLLEMDSSQIELLFSSPGPIIRQSLDLATALSYAKIFEEAGAICHISALKPGTEELDESVAAQPVEIPKKSAISVVSADPIPAEAMYAPFSVPRLSGWEEGIDVNRKDKSRFSYSEISLVSVFGNVEENEKRFSVLIYIGTNRRGYLMEGSKIIFQDFPGVKDQMLLSSLRKFIAYLLEKNPDIHLDKRTYDFLQGVLPSLIKQDVACLATALGKVVESPEALAGKKEMREPPGPSPQAPSSPKTPPPSSPEKPRPQRMEAAEPEAAPRPLVKGLWKEEPDRIRNEWRGPTIEMILSRQPSAPLHLRFLAALLTLLVAGSFWLILFIPTDLLFTSRFGVSVVAAYRSSAPALPIMRGALSAMAFLLLFYAIVVAPKPSGQTWGQRLAGIRVIRSDGTPASGMDTWFLRFLGYLVLGASLGVLYIMSFLSPERLSLADRISRTREVRLVDRPSVVWQLIPIAVFCTLATSVFSYRSIWETIPESVIIWVGLVFFWIAVFFGYRAIRKGRPAKKA